MEFESLQVIDAFYPEDTPLRRLLLKHSIQVRDKALAILDSPLCPAKNLDRSLVYHGAMLHDIGIYLCHAPDILCVGKEPYLAHGTIGAELLREYGRNHHLEMEPYARICERHTGTGITAQDIREQHLPMPERDFLPETPEEKLICLADKFFSKSGDLKEKSLERVRHSMERFGIGPQQRLENLIAMFLPA